MINYRMKMWNYNTGKPIYTKEHLTSMKKTYTPSSCLFLLVLIIILGFSFQALVTGVLMLIDYINPQLLSSYNEMIDNAFFNSPNRYTLLRVVIVAPIAEELAFRGVGLTLLSKFLTRTSSVLKNNTTNMHLIKVHLIPMLLISLLFGLYHQNPVQQLYAIPMGFVLCSLTVLFTSIIPAIILHITINGAAYLMPAILFNTKEMTIISIIISLIIILITIYLINNIAKCLRNRKQNA